MALWKITVKFNTVRKGQRLEKGMSVEIPTPSTSDPLGSSKYREQVAAAFSNRYAINLDASVINHSYFDSEKIS